MTESSSHYTEILSFLTGEPEKNLQGQLAGNTRFRMSDRDSTTDLSEIMARIGRGDIVADVVLIPAGLDELRKIKGGAYERVNCGLAIIAVLTDDSLEGAIEAAKVGFDGILGMSFDAEQLVSVLESSLQRCRARLATIRRYEKVRTLCRTLNHRRRRLRDKIDLVCSDLVSSNIELTNVLHTLRGVYEYQNSLMDEYDLNLLLHRSLREFRGCMADANLAIYLTDTSEFEAHITSSWFSGEVDIEELEEALGSTVVREVLVSGRECRIDDVGNHARIGAAEKETLAGLSIMATPVQCESGCVAVLAAYRKSDNPLDENEILVVRPYLKPLGRAIASLRKLEAMLATRE